MYPLKLVRWRYNKKGESGKEARVSTDKVHGTTLNDGASWAPVKYSELKEVASLFYFILSVFMSQGPV